MLTWYVVILLLCKDELFGSVPRAGRVPVNIESAVLKHGGGVGP